MISIPVADNQEPIARSLREDKVACVLKEDADEVAFRHSIKTYLTDEVLRKAHRERGLQLVDGEGTERVANNIAKISSL
jgi:spore coat polysaccharide biosynthesis predicted glycosyltransferase SpsG